MEAALARVMSSHLNAIEIRRTPQGPQVHRRWAPPSLARSLGVDPSVEVAAQRLAAAQGLAPAVYDFDADRGGFSMAFVAGEPLEADWVQRPERVEVLLETIKKLRCIDAAGLPGIDLPARLLALHTRLAGLDALAARAWAAPLRQFMRRWHRGAAGSASVLAGRVLVHGDLGPGNLIVQADGRPCLLDFEYAHRGHPDEDLAGLAAQPGVEASLAARLHAASVDPGAFADRVELRRLLDGVWVALAARLQSRARVASV